MKLYSYIVARDFGFAPNPFYGVCTLATCKPRIRSVAEVTDWVVGLRPKKKHQAICLVYAMCINETLTYNEYWDSKVYQNKKPNLQGSKKQAFGDNIYCFNLISREWKQANSHHSFADGSINPANVRNDTQTDRILIGKEFAYWGGSGPVVPEQFLDFGPNHLTLSVGRNHKSDFSIEFVSAFADWFHSLKEKGFLGEPADWRKTF